MRQGCHDTHDLSFVPLPCSVYFFVTLLLFCLVFYLHEFVLPSPTEHSEGFKVPMRSEVPCKEHVSNKFFLLFIKCLLNIYSLLGTILHQNSLSDVEDSPQFFLWDTCICENNPPINGITTKSYKEQVWFCAMCLW